MLGPDVPRRRRLNDVWMCWDSFPGGRLDGAAGEGVGGDALSVFRDSEEARASGRGGG